MSSVLKKADKLNLSLSWISKVKFGKCCISGMEEPIDMEQKGCESIGCYTHFVNFNVPLSHDLDLGFLRSNFDKVVSQEWND